MSKTDFRGQLQTIKNNYYLVQTGVMFLAQPDALEKFDEYFTVIESHPDAQFGYIRYVFESDELLTLAINQLRMSVLRNCMKEMFEVTKLYCKNTNQSKVLEAASWYQFLRMTRNSLSHDFHLRYNKTDLKLLPVTWSGLTLTVAMNNYKLPSQGFLTRQKVEELIDEVIQYIEKNVN